LAADLAVAAQAVGGPAGRAEGRRQLGDSGRPSAMGAVATAAHCHKAHGPPRACGRRRPTTATLPAAGRCSGRLRPRPGSTRSRPGESHRPRCPQLHLASKLSPSRSQLPPRLPASAPPARSVGSTFQWWPRASRPLVAAVRLRQRPSRPPAGPAGVVKLGTSGSPDHSPPQGAPHHRWPRWAEYGTSPGPVDSTRWPSTSPPAQSRARAGQPLPGQRPPTGAALKTSVRQTFRSRLR